MKYYRCKCGKREWYGSDGPHPCLGCPDCGTNLASSPDAHVPVLPHKWFDEQVQTNEGLKPLTRCWYCMRTKFEIEKKVVSDELQRKNNAC